MTPNTNRHLLTIGPWRINLARDMVTGPEGASGLNPRAESLLLVLCRSANLLVTREQILEEVWAGRIVEEAAISNAVWQIRKALGEHGKEILQTRLKRGYVLVVPDSAWQSDEASSAETAHDVPAVHAPERGSDALAVPDPMLAPEIQATAPPVVPIELKRQIGLRAITQSRYRWLIAVAVVAVAFGSSAALWAWMSGREMSGRIALRPDVEMTVFIGAPQSLDGLREAVLRTVVEEAYLRDTSVLLFEKPQRRNPFAGPHLQLDLQSQASGGIVADMSITQGSLVAKQTFRGSPNQLASAVRIWMLGVLPPASKKPTPASDAFVSGLMAENRFDNQTAIGEYRKAIARDPRMIDAKIALAQVHLRQGRWRTALDFIDEIDGDAELMASQRCELNMVLVRAAPELLRKPLCARVENEIKLDGLQMRDLLRQIEDDHDSPQGPVAWDWQRTRVISALLQLHEWSLASAEIESMDKIAEDAGWELKRADLIGWRALMKSYQGKWEEEAQLRVVEADKEAAIGDIDSALSSRVQAIRTIPVVPGPAVQEQRKALQDIIDRAREIGSVYNELIALQTLVRLDADDHTAWQSEMERMNALVNENYTSISGATHRYFLLYQILMQGRYGQVIDGAAALSRADKGESEAKRWNWMLRIEAHFARDELDEAIAVVDSMEKSNVDTGDTGETCLFGWLFTEARQPVRARRFLKQCEAESYDRGMQAFRGDLGLFARTRLFQLDGQPERAWPTLLPRIDVLLATPDLSAREAASLAFLARHATTMPGADRKRLQRALQLTTTMATRDGAGPHLRLGVHLLAWRLCRLERTECGAVLPPWAQENRWEARMAQTSQALLHVDQTL
jgi:DNA-binding winged helix-turn-helix (wHTH) protein